MSWVIREPLAFIIRKTIIVQTYGEYPSYVTPDDKIITRMLHLPPDKNRLHNKKSAQSVKEHTAEYAIDHRGVCDILDQICNDTNLYPYIKQRKSKRNSRGEFCTIHSR